MALARKNKGVKFSQEHKDSLSVSNKIAYDKKIATGWKDHKHYSRRDPKEIASTHIFRQYKNSSKKRFGELKLTKEQVDSLINQNCVYCGASPRERYVMVSHYAVKTIANGIDRVDNSKPYTLDNCVPCCKTCNLMKHKLTVETFKEQIRKVYNHICL